MRIKAIVFAAAAAILLTGCNGQEKEFTRYPRVAIPQYDKADYFRQLLSNRSEIVYNAVCNLQDDVVSIETMLESTTGDRNSKEFILSRAIYNQMRYLLVLSRDDNVTSAVIRFLQLYSARAGSNEDLVQRLMKVESKNENVLYERMAALSWAASPSSGISDRFLRDSLRDPSWIVSRTTCFLVNRLERDTFRKVLIGRYRATRDETEKLLIFIAFRNNFSVKDFDFMAQELLSTKSRKIKKAIFNILENARDQEAVLAWLDKQYEKLSKDDIDDLVETYASRSPNVFRARLFRILLAKGLVPKEDLMNSWAESLGAYQEKKTIPEKEQALYDELVKLDQDLTANEALRETWRSHKEKTVVKVIDQELQAEHDRIVDEFAARMDALLTRYPLDADKKKEYLDMLLSIKGYFTDTFGE